MARKDEGNDAEVNDSSRATSSHIPSHAANALQSLLGGPQLSFLDPNVMMVTNAAAAIAAVAASAAHQLNRGSNSSVQGGVAVPAISPALLASLRNAGVSQTTANPPVPPQIVSLLAAATGGGSHHGLQLQATTSSSVTSHLHQLLSQQDSSKLHTPPTPTSLPVGVASKSTSHSGMQNWNLAQLEKHVSLLQQMKQPIPQSVALLLADAQRKEKKKTAKRAANRKSASTSRARKKALVEEMARTNARLRRQALILALLPDLVVATNLDGEINFCSAQVERILSHKPEDLVGAHLDSLLVPSSRDTLKKLFKRLINPGKPRSSRQAQARRGSKRRHNDQNEAGEKSESKDEMDGKRTEIPGRASSQLGDANSGNSATTSGAAIISEQSFPLSVVEVDSKLRSERRDDSASAVKAANANENSDNSTSNNSSNKQQVSSLSNATGLQSPAECPSEDDGVQGGSEGSKRAKTTEQGKQQTSSDDSSLSSDAKNMRNANDNLDRNVRWHNQRMMGDNQKAKSDDGPKDDVTGASVTANNASARLSSLKHVPNPTAKKSDNAPIRYENDQSSSDDSLLAGVEEKKKVGNNSDDSGYRESNDSREETSSSGSDSSDAKKRRKPIAPTCRLCLIRSDLTTVWCEVTSSLRTRTPDEDPLDLQLSGLKASDSVTTEPPKKEPEQEFLLCFRPMRDGEKKVDESLRFVSARRSLEIGSPTDVVVSSSGNDSNSQKGSSDKTFGDDSDSKLESTSSGTPKRQFKKRSLGVQIKAEELDGKTSKRVKTGESEGKGKGSEDTEKSVVESLMLMNKCQ